MAGTVSSLVVKVGADIRELRSAMNTASKSIKDTGKKMTSLGKTISTRVTAPLTALAGVAVKAFGEQERAELRLRAALQANGRAVDSLFKEYTTFASEMQKVTVIGDEASIAMLAQAEALGLTGESAMRAVKNSIAMQSAFGVNAQSALRYTAALEQGNSTMLARYIPALRDLDDESQRVAEAQRILGNAFSAAESDANGVIGAMTQLKNAMGDAMEDIGGAIADAFNLTESRDRLITQIQQIRDWFASLSKEARKNMVMIGAAIAGIGPALVAAGLAVTAFGAVLGALTSPIALVIGAIAGIALAGTYVVKNLEAIGDAISEEFRSWVVAAQETKTLMEKIILSIASFAPGVTGQAARAMNKALKIDQGVIDENKKEFQSFGEFAKDIAGDINSVFANLTGIDFSTMFTPVTQETELARRSVEGVRVSTNKLRADMSLFREVAVPAMKTVSHSMNGLRQASAFAMDVANSFTSSFGQGMANVIVQGEKLVDTLKNIGKLLASAVIQKGLSVLLTGGLGGTGFFGSGGGLFGRIFGVNDALITSGGDVVKFNSADDILASKNMDKVIGGGGGGRVEVFGTLRGQDLFISSDRGSKTYRR